MGQRRRQRRGMTLVEVLVASVLLGLGVAGLMASASMGLRNQRRVEERTAAMYLAQEKLAEVESVGPHIWSLTRPKQGSEQREQATYSWSLALQQQQVGELFIVQVTVEWDGLGGSGEVTLETWLNDYEAVAHMAAEAPEAQQAPETPQSGR